MNGQKGGKDLSVVVIYGGEDGIAFCVAIGNVGLL